MQGPKKITIELDKPRTWCFDINAQIALHEALGDDAFDQMQAIASNPDAASTPWTKALKVSRALIWCGLVTEDPDLTLKQVGAMLSVESMNRIVKQSYEAISADPEQASSSGAIAATT